MKNKQAASRRFVAVLGVAILVLTVAVVDARRIVTSNQQVAITDDPDFLTLNPDSE